MLAARAQGGTSACHTGAALSFVSCIRLFGSSFALRVLRCRFCRAVRNPATRYAGQNATACSAFAGTRSRDSTQHRHVISHVAAPEWVVIGRVPDASLKSEAFHSPSTGKSPVGVLVLPCRAPHRRRNVALDGGTVTVDAVGSCPARLRRRPCSLSVPSPLIPMSAEHRGSAAKRCPRPSRRRGHRAAPQLVVWVPP
jgi:hypothetical protein